MKLLELKLRNFKGIRNLDLEANGQDLRIYGDNATGKTTIYDAFLWLLFDKDSSNRKDFEIKTLGPDGEPEHGLEHTVEARLQLPNGKQLTLKKDRKSTRLNSSHVRISYAVFCLKKKKKKYKSMKNIDTDKGKIGWEAHKRIANEVV